MVRLADNTVAGAIAGAVAQELNFVVYSNEKKKRIEYGHGRGHRRSQVQKRDGGQFKKLVCVGPGYAQCPLVSAST